MTLSRRSQTGTFLSPLSSKILGLYVCLLTSSTDRPSTLRVSPQRRSEVLAVLPRPPYLRGRREKGDKGRSHETTGLGRPFRSWYLRPVGGVRVSSHLLTLRVVFRRSFYSRSPRGLGPGREESKEPPQKKEISRLQESWGWRREESETSKTKTESKM